MTARLVLVAAAVLAAPGAAVLAQEPGGEPPGAAECARRLDDARYADDPDAAAPRLGDVCAELAAALDGQVWGRAVDGGSAEALTSRSFAELLELIEHYERPAGARAELALDELGAIAASLGSFERIEELSLWQRLLRWLEERFGLEESDGGGLADWLRNFSLPEQWTRVIVYSLGALIVIAALVVAVNELRLGGAFRGGAGGRRGRRFDARTAGAGHEPIRTLADLRRVPPSYQPVLLLGLLLARLRRRFSAPLRASLTHRELAAAAGALGVPRRPDFDAVVAAAERVTFGDWSPDAVEAERVLAHGAAVLRELDDAEGAAPR